MPFYLLMLLDYMVVKYQGAGEIKDHPLIPVTVYNFNMVTKLLKGGRNVAR